MFTDLRSGTRTFAAIDYPVVIKASGLAAGKGVLIPATADEAVIALRFGHTRPRFWLSGRRSDRRGKTVGEEVSLLCFSDGVTVKPDAASAGSQAPVGWRPWAEHRWHRQVLAGADLPPGSCGRVLRTVLQTAIDGMRAEGRPFVGVLYAGLMLTADGRRVLEFNCRFGDPETQVLLPLLDSDLLTVAEACADGPGNTEVKWNAEAAACVTLAAEGYPGEYPTDE